MLSPLAGAADSEFDHLITHGATLPLLRAAYSDDLAFSEMSLIVKEGIDRNASGDVIPSHAGWHHDGHHPECGKTLMQSSVIWYLTDVPRDGAAFTVVPGSHLRSREDLARACAQVGTEADAPMPGAWPIAAPAGTAIIMNSNIWHASQPNCSPLERRTVHLYYHRPWVKPTGIVRDGKAYMPRLARTATVGNATFWRQFFHCDLLGKL